jgi:membrane associated rhomboid family serine protease
VPLGWSAAAACPAVAQWWRRVNAAFLHAGVHHTCTGPLATIVLLLPVLLTLRLLLGGPIAAWAFGSSASRTLRGASFAGSSSIMPSILLTVGVNAALYYFRRRQGPVR